MKKIILNTIFFITTQVCYCQYDFINLLNIEIKRSPILVEGKFDKKQDQQKKYYEFSNDSVSICYYPKQNEVDCGYFILNDQEFELNNIFPKNVACDLDYGSFELHKYVQDIHTFYILSAIRYGSGSSTRTVYHFVFWKDEDQISFLPLWGIYSSAKNFGDFNNDGNLDFLEIRYNKFDPDYKLTFTTLENNKFVIDESLYIIFKKQLVDNQYNLLILEKKWF